MNPLPGSAIVSVVKEVGWKCNLLTMTPLVSEAFVKRGNNINSVGVGVFSGAFHINVLGPTKI